MARHPKLIKWDEVIERIEVGNSAQTIANVFDIDVSAFYRRCEDEFGCTFNEKKRQLIENRNHKLEYKQYQRALQGNDRMLIWLGQVWLGQTPAAPNAKPSNENYQIVAGKDDPGIAIGLPAERLSEEHCKSSE